MATFDIQIVLNGERKNVPAGLSVLELLSHLTIPADRVAVEVNRQIVRRNHWEALPIVDGAQVEIVHFVGGG